MTHTPCVQLRCWMQVPARAAATVCVVLVLAINIGGCVSVRYHVVKTDSPRPQTDVIACSGSLDKKGQRCLARVQADQLFTSTNLDVKAGQNYKVVVPPDQVWYDADRRNVPPKGDAGSCLMKLGNSLKRHVDADWFTLVATVTDPCVKHSLGEWHYLSAEDNTMHVQHDGVLVMYPNDAIPLRFRDIDSSQTASHVLNSEQDGVLDMHLVDDHPDRYYQNNSGQIWVFIERLED